LLPKRQNSSQKISHQCKEGLHSAIMMEGHKAYWLKELCHSESFSELSF
jgi:hypothetical protein